MAQSKKNTKNLPQAAFWRRLIITGFFASLLLVIANSAYWVNRNIFDTNTFTEIAVTSVTSESSRQAIADEVVDRALQNQPIIKEIAGPTASKLVSSLLGTDQFNKILETAVSRLQVYLTSNERESIVLNLSGVKNVFESLITIAGKTNSDVEAKVSAVPDKIVLVDADNIPNFYKYGLAFLWIGPIAAVLAFLLLAYPYIRDRSRYYIIALAQGAMITAMGFLCLLVGPLFKPPVLANIPSANSRVVVSNIYDAFISTFNSQSLLLVKVGIALAVVPLLVHYGLKLYHARMLKKKDA